MALVEYATRGIGALSVITVSRHDLYTALYSRGLQSQIISSAGNVGHLQGEDDQEEIANYFTDTGHFSA
jgi:hypothetical protein